MKKVLYSLFITLVVFASCRKEDNSKLPDLVRVPVPLITKEADADQTISATDASTFSGKITVDLYFKNDVKPQKFDIVVIKNGNKSLVKTLQADVTTFPSTVTITGDQLLSLFPEEIVLGDYFDIGANVTAADGNVYEAFPANGNGYGTGVANQPGASVSVRYSAVCTYDPEIYQGDFVVVEDEWADYAPGDIVPLTKIDDTHFSFEYLADDAQPIVVEVDPITNITSVTKQVYGSGYGGASWPYGDISAESVPGNDDYVAPCDGIFSVVLQHTVAAGSFGTARIVLQKKQ